MRCIGPQGKECMSESTTSRIRRELEGHTSWKRVEFGTGLKATNEFWQAAGVMGAVIAELLSQDLEYTRRLIDLAYELSFQTETPMSLASQILKDRMIGFSGLHPHLILFTDKEQENLKFIPYHWQTLWDYHRSHILVAVPRFSLSEIFAHGESIPGLCFKNSLSEEDTNSSEWTRAHGPDWHLLALRSYRTIGNVEQGSAEELAMWRTKYELPSTVALVYTMARLRSRSLLPLRSKVAILTAEGYVVSHHTDPTTAVTTICIRMPRDGARADDYLKLLAIRRDVHRKTNPDDYVVLPDVEEGHTPT